MLQSICAIKERDDEMLTKDWIDKEIDKLLVQYERIESRYTITKKDVLDMILKLLKMKDYL